jgi:hypothetical protein
VKKPEYDAHWNSCFKEVDLFHATGESNILFSAENNLYWRQTKPKHEKF